MNLVETTIEALKISPNIGVTGYVGEVGVIAALMGATYLKTTRGTTSSASTGTS